METLALKNRCKVIAIFIIFCLMLELLILCDRTGFAVENERSEKDILLQVERRKANTSAKTIERQVREESTLIAEAIQHYE